MPLHLQPCLAIWAIAATFRRRSAAAECPRFPSTRAPLAQQRWSSVTEFVETTEWRLPPDQHACDRTRWTMKVLLLGARGRLWFGSGPRPADAAGGYALARADLDITDDARVLARVAAESRTSSSVHAHTTPSTPPRTAGDGVARQRVCRSNLHGRGGGGCDARPLRRRLRDGRTTDPTLNRSAESSGCTRCPNPGRMVCADAPRQYVLRVESLFDRRARPGQRQCRRDHRDSEPATRFRCSWIEPDADVRRRCRGGHASDHRARAAVGTYHCAGGRTWWEFAGRAADRPSHGSSLYAGSDFCAKRPKYSALSCAA